MNNLAITVRETRKLIENTFDIHLSLSDRLQLRKDAYEVYRHIYSGDESRVDASGNVVLFETFTRYLEERFGKIEYKDLIYLFAGRKREIIKNEIRRRHLENC